MNILVYFGIMSQCDIKMHAWITGLRLFGVLPIVPLANLPLVPFVFIHLICFGILDYLYVYFNISPICLYHHGKNSAYL